MVMNELRRRLMVQVAISSLVACTESVGRSVGLPVINLLFRRLSSALLHHCPSPIAHKGKFIFNFSCSSVTVGKVR